MKLCFFVMFKEEVVIRILLHVELLDASIEEFFELVNIMAFTC